MNKNPRELMERAIEVMRQSIHEPRDDGKASPRVGAVLLRADGTVETAYRGELRDGDHAEYTLLERKCRDQNLAGAVLFATLEPCAPKARKFPKLGCSERIVLARIKEVWIGIEDPDPTVDRKGIKHLQDSGVTVHMFDRDLQGIIQAENKDFIAQARERAAAAEEKTPEIVLSPLEDAPTATDLEDLSAEALEAYRSIARIEEAVDTPAFRQRLVRQGVLKPQGDRFVPTGFGFLLFGKEPRTAFPQAGLLGTIHTSGDQQEIKNFEGPLIFAPDQAIQWLRDKLPNPIDRSEARRREVNATLYKLVREGIVNALVHRDYDIVGGKCQLVVTPDRIVIMSPGLPVDPITLEQIQSFSAPMLSRNPVLHHIFSRMEMAEERGLGLGSMRQSAEAAGLPLPRYTWNAPYLVLTIFRDQEAAMKDLNPEILSSFSKAEGQGWQWITTQDQIRSLDYAEALGVPQRTALNHLRKFTALGLLERSGSGPSTFYVRVT